MWGEVWVSVLRGKVKEDEKKRFWGYGEVWGV